jgi:hypothetical protein
MPLNPPSYSGQDVWYSPDVYVNQVPVALWQPAQSRAVPEVVAAKLQAFIDSEDLQFQNQALSKNQTAAAVQKMVADGLITQAEADRAKNATTLGGDVAPPDKQTGTVNTNTGGIEYRTDINSSTQISRNFTLGQLTEKTNVFFPHWYERGIYKTGQLGKTPGQLVANARLLATNVLDLVRDQWPGMALTSTIRPPGKNPGSQHPYFQAADMQLPRGQWDKHYDMAVWIMNNTPYDQLLLEFEGSSTWVHVSYADPPIKKKGDPTKVGVMNAVTGAFVKTNGLARV